MAKEIGKIERKHRSRVGTFFFGWFIGFIVTIGLIVGAGAFVYFKVSPAWVNKTFHTNIDLGSKEANSKTLSDFVNTAIGIVNNIDTYTLNDIEKDFGVDIGDEIYGISISDLKNVPITKISDKLEDKINSISAYELREIINLDSMDSILGSTVTYYVRSNKLTKLKNDSYVEVDFEYRISGNFVTIKGEQYQIVDGKIYPTIKKIPLVDGISYFVDTMGDNITLGDLKTKFGVELPTYLATEANKNKTINELPAVIDDLFVADILGYTISGAKVYDGTEEVTGVMATVSKKQVKELGDVMDDINGLTIAEIMDYKQIGGVWYESDGTTKLTGVMKAIAGIELGNMSNVMDTVNDMTISEIMDYKQIGGVWYESDGETPLTGVMKTIAGVKLGNMNDVMDTVNDMTIAEILDYKKISGVWYESDGETALTGVMKTIAEVKLGNMNNVMDTVNDMTIAEILDYTKTSTPGIMNAIADIKLGDLSTEIDDITVDKIFDTTTGPLSLIPSTTTITNIPSAIEDAISTKTLGELQGAGLIGSSVDLNRTVKLDGTQLKDLSIDEAIELIPAIPMP